MIKKIKLFLKNNKIIYNIYSAITRKRRIYLNQPYETFNQIFSNVDEGSLVLKVNNIPGKYEIDCRSHILARILVTKEYESSTVNLIKKNTSLNKDAINIGANIGLFTNLLANIINEDKKVLSIEPTPNAYKYLESNIDRNNNRRKVITYKGIATDKAGKFEINLIQGKEEYSSIGEIVHPAVKDQEIKRIEVDGETVDHLVEKYCLEPGIVVIDVEGAEFQVLSGAINTIQRFKPIIISELDDSMLEKLNSNSYQIITLLENNGYKVKDIENKKITFPFSGNIIAISTI